MLETADNSAKYFASGFWLELSQEMEELYFFRHKSAVTLTGTKNEHKKENKLWFATKICVKILAAVGGDRNCVTQKWAIWSPFNDTQSQKSELLFHSEFIQG